jgi:hypothetical protein
MLKLRQCGEKGKELMGGAHESAKGEREGDQLGLNRGISSII